MNTINIKKVIIGSLIAMVVIATGIFLYYSYDIINAKGTTEAAYWGGLIGSGVTGLIALLSLFFTLQSNKSTQKRASNLQISLKVEDSLNHEMEIERTIISDAYNHLEKFVYMSMKITPSNNSYNEMKNSLINLYGNFSSSVNLIRFNSEIFYDKSKCEGCESCNIKTYGLLVKDAMLIQKEVTEIETECNIIISCFETMLNLSSECSRLLETKSLLESSNSNYHQLIEIKNNMLSNPITPEVMPLINDISNLRYKIDENMKQISLLDVQFNDKLKVIGEHNSLARSKANEIYVKQRGKFATCIYKYFESYKLYIQECVYSIEQKGKKRSYKCAKLDFEKNHGVK